MVMNVYAAALSRLSEQRHWQGGGKTSQKITARSIRRVQLALVHGVALVAARSIEY